MNTWMGTWILSFPGPTSNNNSIIVQQRITKQRSQSVGEGVYYGRVGNPLNWVDSEALSGNASLQIAISCFLGPLGALMALLLSESGHKGRNRWGMCEMNQIPCKAMICDTFEPACSHKDLLTILSNMASRQKCKYTSCYSNLRSSNKLKVFTL